MQNRPWGNIDGLHTLCALLEERCISHTAFVVGVALCRYMNPAGYCWPSREALGARAGIARIDTVSKAIKELVDVRFITSQKSQRSNHYQLGSFHSVGALSASAEALSCRRGKRVGKEGVQDPADALSVLSTDAESASAHSTYMKKSKKYSKDTAVQVGSTSPRKIEMNSTPKPKVTWDGVRFAVPEVQMNLWKAAFPDIDIPHEIDKAAAWLVSTGQRKKAHGRFLNNWLARAKPAPGRKPAFEASDKAVADFLAGHEESRRAVNE